MTLKWTGSMMLSKHFFYPVLLFAVVHLAACSTNPATGQNQFAGLMPPEQENAVGAQEHEKVLQEYALYQDQAMQNYVQQVGNRVVQGTERGDVQYKFFLLDSPMVNAFALPGGYIYLTRGLMALSNNEAEMAAVLAHEAGHITGRHSAERFSRGMVSTLGAAVLSAAIGSDVATQALGIGNDLYIKSYSRGQENQADSLGIRYLSRAGYDPRAMSGFLSSLNADTQLEAQIKGKSSGGATDYFSTHPATAERVSLSAQDAAQYPSKGDVNRDGYLRRIDGMTYGDSADQGFVRGDTFYHPKIGFAFSVPRGFEVGNKSDQVLMMSQSGAAIVFDMVPNRSQSEPMEYLARDWAKGEPMEEVERFEINGMSAATASFDGAVNGQPMRLRLIAIDWGRDRVARFMVALPSSMSRGELEAMQRTTYSFRRMGAQERDDAKPHRLRVVQARSGDTVASMASPMAVPDYRQARFLVLNGLREGDAIVPGALYKIVSDR